MRYIPILNCADCPYSQEDYDRRGYDAWCKHDEGPNNIGPFTLIVKNDTINENCPLKKYTVVVEAIRETMIKEAELEAKRKIERISN